MLNNLKQAVRKKKLYFTVVYSAKNVNSLCFLLSAQYITSFVIFSHNSIIVWINYCYGLNGALLSTSTNLKKLSKQQNKNVNNDLLDSNFVVNTFVIKTVPFNSKKSKKFDYITKFR